MLLLSATVGNSRRVRRLAPELPRRRLELVESNDRKVPLTYHWVGDQLLTEQLEEMAEGDGEARMHAGPGLLLQSRRVLDDRRAAQGQADPQRAEPAGAAQRRSSTSTTGRKASARSCRQMLMRGVGVHHAGLLPKYRRIVEDLFQQKLLSVAICTETLAAGINLPARSVVVPSC